MYINSSQYLEKCFEFDMYFYILFSHFHDIDYALNVHV